MGCTTCGATTPDGSTQCPDCARDSADRWREAHRAKARGSHSEEAHRHERWWWQRRVQESRETGSSGVPSTGALYALASHHRERRAHEGVLWGLVALLTAGSVGVIRVAQGAGSIEQVIWAMTAFAAGLLGAELFGERESVLRMLVFGPIGVVLVGVIALAAESGAVLLAVVMPVSAVVAAVVAHLVIRRRRQNAPVARRR